MVIGIDEVGRGAWAGPLLVCAIGLDNAVRGLKDSKQLTDRKRRLLAKEIKQSVEIIGLGWVAAQEIDQFGLRAAMSLGIDRALTPFEDITAHEIIIDGNIDYLQTENSRAEVKAEDQFTAVAAASIIAKVARDNYMQNLSQKYPQHGFEQHVGYGTQLHSAALKRFGITPIHRQSFKPVKSYL